MKYLILRGWYVRAVWEENHNIEWCKVIAIHHPVYGIHYRKRTNPATLNPMFEVQAYCNEYGVLKWKAGLNGTEEFNLRIEN